jgi:hypothetical protein
VYDHRDMVRVIERRGRALECRLVEVPFRRGEPPDKLGEVATVSFVASAAAIGGEIELVPPLPMRYPLTATRALQRRGQSAAMISADRAPQSNPARMARSMRRASIIATVSSATAEGWPFRKLLSDTNRVGPKPRRYGMITR